MAKVLLVLYADPAGGYPTEYPRDDLPKLEHYPDGQTLPTPSATDFRPGSLLGSVSGELGLRPFLEAAGHQLVVTSDKDGEDSILDRELVDADIIISQPFWPAYMTAERIAKARNLKMIVTAGIGSDHTDLQAAIDRGITVAEVTYCNSISVAEHVVMMILSLVRNYLPSHQVVLDGGWNIADCAARSYDVEGMHVGTVAAGRIGLAVLRRMKRGAYLVNTARGKIVDRDAVARALESGQLAGYAGDVWFPQPAPRDHVWRTMPNHGMTPHISGTSLSAQARYAAGVREILECYFENRPIREEYLIVEGGRLAGVGAHSYSEGDATAGSEEAARFGPQATPNPAK